MQLAATPPSWRARAADGRTTARTRRRTPLRLLLAGAVSAAAMLTGAAPAEAHPLGNATVNHYDGLHFFPDHITDTAVEDVAEIPTYQRRPDIDTDRDGTLSDGERSAYAARQCTAMLTGLSLRVDGRAVPLRVASSDYQERLGAISLTAGRLTCELTGPADLSRAATVDVDSAWDSSGIGWHEITAQATGVALQQSPFPAASISSQLRAYPADLLSSPLDVRTGRVSVVPGAGSSSYALARRLPVAGPLVQALNSLATTFNETVGRKDLTVGVGLLAVLLSLLLGAGHAFLPGHGKTIMAAYLVGRRGRLRDVVTVGATVTVTHTAGVLLLGLAITTTAAFAPTAAEQALGALSGLIVVVVGLGLLGSAIRRHRDRVPVLSAQDVPDVDAAVTDLHLGGDEAAVARTAGGAGTAVLAPLREHGSPHEHHDHEHDHDHAHEHHDHQHHDHDDTGPAAGVHRHGFGRGHRHGPGDGGFSRSGLVGLGVAGGLVPSPSALLVLLAATALGRTVFGVALVLAYGVGMAGALSAAGLLLVRLRGRLDRYADSPRLARAQRLIAVLPILTALLVVAVGVGLTARALGGSV